MTGKLARTALVAGPSSPLRTTLERTLTGEGSLGYVRDAKSELFTLAATNMVGEDTFYESAAERDSRLVDLVRQVAATDPGWLARLVPYVRDTLQLRSGAVVLAVESVLAVRALPEAPADFSVRKVIASACSRADEPGEVLAYWRARAGRTVPSGVQRGIADAVTALYSQRAALKYDGQGQAWRLGDVIEVVHPKPANTAQANLFRWLLDRRRHDVGNPGRLLEESLGTISQNLQLRWQPRERQRELLLADPSLFEKAAVTWEYLGGLGPMDAAAWTAVLPQLGYMALIRNLRNLDEAGVPDDVVAPAIARIADPSEVAASRQLPFRFLSAYKAAPSLRWGHALSKALDLSMSSVPQLRGRWLVLVDTSGSMGYTLSAKSTVARSSAAGVLAASLVKACDDVTLGVFASAVAEVPLQAGASALQYAEFMDRINGSVGHGTNMAQAVRSMYAGHDAVVIVTDDQSADGDPGDAMPAHVPLFRFNVAGYRPTSGPVGKQNRYEVAGLSDKAFVMLEQLAGRRDATWPF